jgi:hypothetical protein
MSRKDLEPEERDLVPLQVESIITCPRCSTEFEAVFQAPDGVFELEDLEDPIEQRFSCPNCGLEWVAIYDGWIVHGDAG